MEKVIIQKSPTADTRSAETVVTKEQLLASSLMHISDVNQAMVWLAELLLKQAHKHDYTKTQAIDQFFADFNRTQSFGDDFSNGEWYKRHVTEERHHLNEHVPDDVNLLDVLERVADCCMAGLARTGKVYSDQLPAEVLQKAYKNTFKLLVDNTEVLPEQK